MLAWATRSHPGVDRPTVGRLSDPYGCRTALPHLVYPAPLHHGNLLWGRGPDVRIAHGWRGLDRSRVRRRALPKSRSGYPHCWDAVLHVVLAVGSCA